MTTLGEAIANLDRSEANQGVPDVDAFLDAFGMEPMGWDDRFIEKIKMYYIQSWVCTDTRVGNAVYFMDGVPVAYSNQVARRSPCHVSFLDHELAVKVKNFLISLLAINRWDSGIIRDMDYKLPDYSDNIKLAEESRRRTRRR